MPRRKSLLAQMYESRQKAKLQQKKLEDEAIDQDPCHHPGLPLLFYRAAVPLSRQTLTYAAWIIRRHRAAIGSCWRKLTRPGRPSRQGERGLGGRGAGTRHRSTGGCTDLA